MAKNRHTNREDIHAPSTALAGRPATGDPAEINEHLQTENEELRRQILELEGLRDQDGRATREAQWLARIADENPDPVMQVSIYGVIQYRNPASVSLCRQWNPYDELVVPPAIHAIVKDAHARATVIRHEMTFGERTYLFTVAPTPPPAKYVNIYARDITARKNAEGALRELNATLEAKVAQRTEKLAYRSEQLQRLTLELAQTEDRERRRMAEILHDDLQQIMAAAKFRLSQLSHRVKYDVALQEIAAQIDQMLKEAIDKSRSLSHELSPAVLYHSDFTETLDWLARQIQAQHGLRVHVHADSPGGLPSEAVHSFLYRTAQELLFNVVKHARVPEAEVRFRRHGHCACLSVRDRGRGFDPQELRQAAGYGLLSIRERIELLGGRMKIRSAPGKGSTFFILVPDGTKPEDRGQKTDDRMKNADERSASVLRPPSSPRRLRVLLADDHKIVREGLRLLLREAGDIEIVGEAMHGREAVDLALRLAPDVVIMDVSMPLIDGDAATRQIKEHLPEIRVIALSTYNEPETIQKMYRAGAEGYLLKTASAEELVAAIRGDATVEKAVVAAPVGPRDRGRG